LSPGTGYTLATPNISATVTIISDDTAGVTVSLISGNTTEDGGTATFTMVLNSRPTADVTIPLSSSNPNEGILSISGVTFTPLNWSTPQIITVTGVDDFTIDGDIAYFIVTGNVSSVDPNYGGMSGSVIDDVAVINEDNDNCVSQPKMVPGMSTIFCQTEFSQNLNDYVTVIPEGFELIWSNNPNFSLENALPGPVVNRTGTYYGFFYNTECTSLPLPVTLATSIPPSITSTTPATICGPGIATLNAAGSAGGGSIIYWYASETATDRLAVGASYTTPINEVTTTYYVEVLANACTSERVPVTVTVLDPIILGTTDDNVIACNKAGEDNTTIDLDDTRIGDGLVAGVWSIVGTPPGAVVIDANNIVDFENVAEGEYVFRFTADTTGSPCVDDNMNPSVDVTIRVGTCGTDPEMDLGLEKMVDHANVSVGDQVVFTVTLTNHSPIIATNVRVNELIDPNITGFEYVSHEASLGTYDLVGGVWTLQEVLGNQVATLVITATVVRQGTFQNNVALSGSVPVDADATNNTARVSVTVGPRSNEECGFMFNQISPNGDGSNDTLFINCIDQYPNNSIQIFDRYGNEVFAARRYDNSWMGTGKNGNLPKGTYFYILDLGDGTEVRKGWIQIIR
ncbi:MAG TPA: gliding motility-associated C-terminal domain-containing protein, partial [Arenibacter sp.]|nr:gliding motility-associated C-terminal domain-containing protein [Arenibacter sp.]